MIDNKIPAHQVSDKVRREHAKAIRRRVKWREYKKWLADGQQVVSLAYMQHVSDCMDRDDDGCDVSGDLLNMGTVGAAYVAMDAAGDWDDINGEQVDGPVFVRLLPNGDFSADF